MLANSSNSLAATTTIVTILQPLDLRANFTFMNMHFFSVNLVERFCT